MEALAQVSELILVLRHLGESSKPQEQDAKRILGKILKEIEDESDNNS